MKDSEPLRMLIVDGEPSARRLMEHALTQAGYLDTFTADTAQTARRLLEGPTDFALVLLDLRLPGESSLALLGELAPRAPGLVTTVVSGVQEFGAAVEALKGGAYDHIVKPFDTAGLQLAVGRALNGSENVQRGQSTLSQKKRRTLSRNRTRQPCMGRSSTVRMYLLWTRSETDPQKGQQVDRAGLAASKMTLPGRIATRVIRSMAGGGNRRSCAMAGSIPRQDAPTLSFHPPYYLQPLPPFHEKLGRTGFACPLTGRAFGGRQQRHSGMPSASFIGSTALALHNPHTALTAARFTT
jgi:DNA-binding response OmpR family regulator